MVSPPLGVQYCKSEIISRLISWLVMDQHHIKWFIGIFFVEFVSRSYSGASHGASVVMETRQAWTSVGSLWRFYFLAHVEQNSCAFVMDLRLPVAWVLLWALKIHIFGALWVNQSGGKTRVDVHQVMSNWSLLCGFEVDLSLGMTWVVLCALNLEILEASCLSEPNTTINRATVHMVISIWELNCAFEVDLRSVMASVYVI